jgi:hypothetical protein
MLASWLTSVQPSRFTTYPGRADEMTDTDAGPGPVSDLATDYDMFDAGYVRDPVPAWAELRGTCPIAHTERNGGSWLPTRYEDVQAMARMVPELSSLSPLVVDLPEEIENDPDTGIFSGYNSTTRAFTQFISQERRSETHGCYGANNNCADRSLLQKGPV